MKIEVNNSLFQDILTGDLTTPRVIRLWNWKMQHGGFGGILLEYPCLESVDFLQNTQGNIRTILRKHSKDPVDALCYGVFDNYGANDPIIYETKNDDGELRINSIQEDSIAWNAVLMLLVRAYADDDDYDIAQIMDSKEEDE
jgi:hypothetical protein